MFTRIGIVLFLTALVCSTTPAKALPVTWYLNGVVFNDGGTASGSFNFDPDAGTPCSTGSVAMR